LKKSAHTTADYVKNKSAREQQLTIVYVNKSARATADYENKSALATAYCHRELCPVLEKKKIDNAIVVLETNYGCCSYKLVALLAAAANAWKCRRMIL
jgi:hypothetical protein